MAHSPMPGCAVPLHSIGIMLEHISRPCHATPHTPHHTMLGCAMLNSAMLFFAVLFDTDMCHHQICRVAQATARVFIGWMLTRKPVWSPSTHLLSRAFRLAASFSSLMTCILSCCPAVGASPLLHHTHLSCSLLLWSWSYFAPSLNSFA